ncbi:DUF3891 family protein [Laceyella tengchongensis]
MIVRKKGYYYVFIKQHDHGLLSGELAAQMTQPIRPLAKTLYAISHHDWGWESLDQSPLWNEETNEPYSFEDYPMLPKLEAYTDGIAKVVAHDPYAGFLCSKHYASFFTNIDDPVARKFREQEYSRQNKLRPLFTEEEEENITANFRLLRFCDDLSLALCFNEPGEEPNHPWFKDGILYQGERYQWVWEGRYHLRLVPNLFKQSFTVEIPYQVFDGYRRLVGRDMYRFTVMV